MSKRLIKDPILGNHQISITDGSYDVLERRVVKGEEIWTAIKYFTSLGGALRYIARVRTISETTESTIRQYIEDYRRITKEITETINNLLK